VVDATTKAGARSTYLITEPIAAALGAEVPIGTPNGNLIVDIGGGTTEVALVSLGGIVAHASIRVGGDKLDQALAAHLRKKHNLSIGEQTAEELKIRIGSAVPEKKEKTRKVPGRDTVGGLPKTINLSTNETPIAMRDELEAIASAIKSVLEQTPPELASDVIDRGIVLTGGGSLLQGLDIYLTRATGVPAHVASEPLLCVAKGLGYALDNLDLYKRNLTAWTP
jgi:rod shape-determining protein MreB